MAPSELPSNITVPSELTSVSNSAEALTWIPPSEVPLSDTGLLFVSGVDGGFIEPADGVYDRLAEHYARQGVPSVFVRYRQPGDLGPSVEDAMSGAQWLRDHGVKRMAILGWSFGGAVITNTTVQVPEIRTVVGFAPQDLDTEPVANFKDQSILLFHSREDENVPYDASLDILDEAPAGIKKQLVSFDQGDHHLDGLGEKIDPTVMAWLDSELVNGKSWQPCR